VRVGKGKFYVLDGPFSAESPVKMQLHAFVFDESFKTLQGQGSAINLAPWYSQTEISILQLYSVGGNDEVVMVDSNAQVRIFSFVTQQARYDFAILFLL
jgi:hypothetical protein